MAGKRTKQQLKFAASQFFAEFGHLSPDVLSKMLDGDVSASTIRRDREKLKKGNPPSEASVEAYLKLQGRAETFDLTNPDELTAVAEAIFKNRRDFQARVTLEPYNSGPPMKAPDFWARVVLRFDQQEWLSVIDVIEPELTGPKLVAFRASKYSDYEPYLRHHIAIAYLRRGETLDAVRHLREGVGLLWNVNSDWQRDVRYHLVTDLALNLMSVPDAMKSDDEIEMLVSHVVDDCLPHPNMISNLLIIALYLGDRSSGYLTGRIEAAIRQPRAKIDYAAALSRIMEDNELKIYHEHDMFKKIENALREQLA